MKEVADSNRGIQRDLVRENKDGKREETEKQHADMLREHERQLEMKKKNERALRSPCLKISLSSTDF